MIREFLYLCDQIGVPDALEKTEWASDMTIFLGILLNGVDLTLCLPLEKRQLAIELLEDMVRHDKTKATVKQLQ